jgi:hypothetical protein
MSKLLVTLIVVACLAPVVPLVGASPDKSNSSCDREVTWYDASGTAHTTPQPWVGYTSSDPLRVLVESIFESQGWSDYTVYPCEGEQWDGHDSVNPAYDPGHAAGCNKADTVANPGVGSPTSPNTDLFVGSCMSPDPNDGGADPLSGNGQPVVFRVSYSNHGVTTHEAFVSVDIFDVGRSSVYQGVCSGQSTPGIQGQSNCQSQHLQDQTAWWGRDNTPGLLLAQVISSLGITKGHVSQGDCDQSTYQSGAEQGNRQLCGRDDTAITVESILP